MTFDYTNPMENGKLCPMLMVNSARRQHQAQTIMNITDTPPLSNRLFQNGIVSSHSLGRVDLGSNPPNFSLSSFFII